MKKDKNKETGKWYHLAMSIYILDRDYEKSKAQIETLNVFKMCFAANKYFEAVSLFPSRKTKKK
ncbi:MAG: hypothetical protein PHS93_10110 [Candidatus Omnitrophica bacterium]|nr:hypothetical protein [Candidatus Omnitrophota bacterium]